MAQAVLRLGSGMLTSAQVKAAVCSRPETKTELAKKNITPESMGIRTSDGSNTCFDGSPLFCVAHASPKTGWRGPAIASTRNHNSIATLLCFIDS